MCAPRQRSLIHFTLGLLGCQHVNVAKFVTPPRTAVLRSRGGVTHSGETRLYRYDKLFQNASPHYFQIPLFIWSKIVTVLNLCFHFPPFVLKCFPLVSSLFLLPVFAFLSLVSLMVCLSDCVHLLPLCFCLPYPSCVLSCDYPSLYLVLSSPVCLVGSLLGFPVSLHVGHDRFSHVIHAMLFCSSAL